MASRRHLPLLILLVATVSGCGGSGGDAPAAAAKPPAVAPATAATTAAAAAPTAATVTITDFEYGPKRIVVAKGARVTWTNQDAANHTVTFDAGAMKSLGNQRTHVKRSRRFADAGTYAYHCDFHPNMHGSVVVR